MNNALGRPKTQDVLTPAEWKVVNALRHGLSNPAIAKRLGVSLDAVKYHVSNAMQKLGFVRRAELRLWNGVAQRSLLSRTRQRQSTIKPSEAPATMTATKESATQHPDTEQLGAIAQIARVVTDIQAAQTWYTEVASLKLLFSFAKMAFFDCAGVRLMLAENEINGKRPKRAQASLPSESILYFRVKDIHAAQAALAARGAVFINAPHLTHRHSDGTEEWMAFFQDNEARPLALVAQVRPPHTTTAD